MSQLWNPERLVQLLKEKQAELCSIHQLMSARVAYDGGEQCFISLHCLDYTDRKRFEIILGDAPFAATVQTDRLGGKGKPTYSFKNEEGAKQRQLIDNAERAFLDSKLNDLFKLSINHCYRRCGMIYLISPVPVDHEKIRAILGDTPYDLEIADMHWEDH